MVPWRLRFPGGGREYTTNYDNITMTETLTTTSSLWYDVPWLLVLSIMLYIVLPSSRVAAGTRARLRMIDWIGVAVSVAAIVLLLVSTFHAVAIT